MYVGLRVVRGPDWSSGERDGGEGHVGTVVSQDGAGRVDVIWDGGQRTTCRAGKDGKHDLRILDTGSIGIRHEGFTCEGCETTNFYGTRWTCKHCSTTSLCSTCYSTDMHDTSHTFLRHAMPGESGVEVKKRSICLMLRSLGLYPGARVVRGEDWSWGKQDGGSGRMGTITEMHDEPRAGTTGSIVRVKWDAGPSNLYRVGRDGKVDVKYVEEAPWIHYFRDNLPVLDLMGAQSTHPVVNSDFEVGCKVCIQLDQDGLKRVQANKGGWTASMSECEGKIGRVTDFPSDGVATVVFDTNRYRLATEALLKVYDHSAGDVVRVLDDRKKVKMLQDKHGGWNHKMEKALGKVGRVKEVDHDGDVVVKFGSTKWYFNPACCVPVVRETVDGLKDSDDDEDPFLAMGLMGGLLENLTESLVRLVDDTPSGGLLSSEEKGGVTEAIIKGDFNTVKAMIESDPHLLSQQFGKQRLTPLMRACHVGKMEIVRFLLDSGADLETKGHKGITALSAAIIGKKEQTVMELLKKGANVHHRHHNGQTTLHLAVHNDLPNILKVLTQKGVDVNATDKAGDTPLHDAISIQKDECAKILIGCPHVNLRLCNHNDFNPLHFACLRGSVTCVERILERDTSFVNALMSDNTFAALHIAANNDHVECCRLLIDKGKAEVDRRGPQGVTPLYVAAGHSQYRSVELLLQKGADPNFENDNGNRPFHGLCKGRGSRRQVGKVVDVARLLLQEGAAYKARNKHGSTALDMCSGEAEKSAIREFIDKNEGFLNSAEPPENQFRPQAPESPSSKFFTPCNKCFDKVADAKFVPCGHKVMCSSCAASFNKCPLCDTHVLHVQTSKRGDDDDDDGGGDDGGGDDDDGGGGDDGGGDDDDGGGDDDVPCKVQ